MTPHKKLHKISLTEATNAKEAFMLMISGYAYFLFKDVKTRVITLTVTALAIGGILWGGYTYATTDKVKIKEFKPIGQAFSLMPMALADGKNEIIINGKIYGHYDENYQVWKLSGEDVLVVYNKLTNKVIGIDMPSIYNKSK